MSWATPYIEQLKQGKTVQFRPKGNSMSPKIKSGQLVTVEPLWDRVIEKGDIVLCRVRGRHYLHLVQAAPLRMDDWKRGVQRVQIGNMRGRTTGTIGRDAIFGVLVKVGE